MLGLMSIKPTQPGAVPGNPSGLGASRFLLPINDCEFTLTSILEELQKDPWTVANQKRPLRSTGAALSIAVGLLEVFFSTFFFFSFLFFLLSFFLLSFFLSFLKKLTMLPSKQKQN